MTLSGLYLLIAVRVKTAGSQKKAADEWGISTAYLNDVLKQRREPGEKILKALGIEKQVCYIIKDES